MALESKDVTLDGTFYRITQLPFTPANKLLVRLTKTFGPALANAIDKAPALGKEGAELALNGKGLGGFADALASGVTVLCERLSEEDLADTFRTLAGACEVSEDGQAYLPLLGCMEIKFSGGNMVHAMKWLKEALQVNYGNFFDALRARGADLLAEEKTPEQA